ncbi:MAG: HNH endonuclease [Oligoflexia bacterium]|nr:HNH endonuclease [Oligoflexia bacterium]
MDNLNYSLKKLSKQQLLEATLSLVKKEKACTLELIAHLEEIEDRRLYAELGYSSMFAYVTKYLNYSENEAQIRISSMRLSRSNPEIKNKISTGELSLTNVGLAAASIKRQENTKGEKLTSSEKSKIIETITNKSTRDAKIELEAIEGSITLKKQVYKIEISEKGLQMVNELKKTMGNYQDSELLELLLSEKIQSLQQQKQSEKKIEPEAVPSEMIMRDNKKPSRYIPKKVKEEVRTRAKSRCEYVSPITGLRCEEVHRLEYDHVIPFSFFGSNSASNLILSCPAHNKLRAINTFGKEKMDQYLKSSTLGEHSDRAAKCGCIDIDRKNL